MTTTLTTRGLAQVWKLLTALAVLSLLAASCGDDDDDVAAEAASTDDGAMAAADDEHMDESDGDMMADDDEHMDEGMDGEMTDDSETMDGDEMMALPGEGVTVTMARGNWIETYFQNYVVQQLLQELGYEVGQPEEIAPATFYPAVALGDFDLWASSWPLNHDPLLAGASPDGGTFADSASYIGTMMASGALQGLLVDIPSVEQFGFSTLEELLDNPDAIAHFDSDGDGRADINGCDDGWGCQKVINDTIDQNGWGDRIAQVSATHSALFAESQASYANGGPVLQYVWTPTAFVGKLVPGRDVLWLAIQPEHALEGQDGVSNVGDSCTNDPCTTMFTPSDIVVTVNNDFAAENPAAASLLESFVMDPLAVAVQAVAIDAGANSEEDISSAAADWIANNRDLVDGWIEEAMAAAG